MTTPEADGELRAALMRLFVDSRGEPAPTQTVSLSRADSAVLVPDGLEACRVVVPDADEVARVTGRDGVSAAILLDDEQEPTLLFATAPVGDHFDAFATGLGAATTDLGEVVRRLRGEAAVVDALHSVGRKLTAQLDIGEVVQNATDAATASTGAAFGAFFYNLVNQFGESYTLYTIAGVPREEFSRFPMPRNTDIFAPTFDGAGTVRSDDITADPRFGLNAPYHGMPDGHLPVRSYLAVSVISPTTQEVLGGFFFGHPETGRFTERHEYLAEGIASYSAIALDNARLFERERTMVAELSRSMLPDLPDIPGLEVVARYLPAATGSKIGGDWFDVIALPSGATAFVIGDVVGHGVTAATTMAQVRTAIRAYASLELSPSQLLGNVSQLTTIVSERNFATCFYAVHDPAADTLTYASAGHLPAVLIHADGGVEQIGEAMAQPLGVGNTYPERRVDFAPGSKLVLYTDGLVETRTRDLTEGIDRLLAGLGALDRYTDTATACDALIAEMTLGSHDDDIAFVHVHHTRSGRR
jgi:hypothetical protein